MQRKGKSKKLINREQIALVLLITPPPHQRRFKKNSNPHTHAYKYLHWYIHKLS